MVADLGAGYSIDQAKYNEYHEEFEANKNVISAAPDLLQAVEWLEQLWGGEDGYRKEEDACAELGIPSPVLVVWRAARAARAKAEGRS